MKALISIGVVVMLSACGGSPTAPTAPPTTPPPTPPARAELVAVPGVNITFPDWPCPTGECRYAFDIRNDGPDCARGVNGRLRLLRDDGVTLVADDHWTLDPARVVAPQEVVRVEDGSIAKSALDSLGDETGWARVTFDFEAVRCA